MTRHRIQPLRPLTETERADLKRLGRAASAPAAPVLRARAVLAVAAGCSYTAAGGRVGRTGDTVARWIARFNQEGLRAVEPRHGGGRRPLYGPAERERILAEFRRAPDRAQDGTATWSLSTLQRALRQAEDGLPHVSTYTLWAVFHEADVCWQRDRSWCHTGRSVRRRTRGGQVSEATVHDPDASAKKA